ncbi:BET1-like protein isoform X3 [Sciurus carolinensis]|uniref:BET1-like protein isoform X3 n=1 Tax=Sciurus carolinensis TaxID=30640 RepID=UPI001FB2A2CC|nr:BET1-like protein isoform X3 [Sciurus carolinensis]
MADWTRAQNPGAVEEILDRENKRMADSLASKVTRLKSLALDIDRDAEDQNRYLDGMDSDFTSMTGLLTGSMKRFSTMARSGRDNRKLLCEIEAKNDKQLKTDLTRRETQIHKVEDRKSNQWRIELELVLEEMSINRRGSLWHQQQEWWPEVPAEEVVACGPALPAAEAGVS